VIEVHKEKEVFKESKVYKVFQDRMELTAQTVLKEKEVHKENKELRAYLVREV